MGWTVMLPFEDSEQAGVVGVPDETRGKIRRRSHRDVPIDERRRRP